MRCIGLTLGLAAALIASGSAGADRPVDQRRLAAAADDSQDWLSYGHTYDEQRYSPLTLINTGNVKNLGLAWFADLDTARGQEATPLVIDGTLFVSTAWSKVKAYDAATGKPRWQYDPEVPGATAVKACCDVVNRGLAAWGGRVFLGTLDGRLIALDRDTGKVAWTHRTFAESSRQTITGAPRVIDGRVIIGSGGAEMGVRGSVSAYDAADGRLLWRFYTVPDRPGANRAAYLRRAESTWKGRWWLNGGGGTVWDSMAYDPKLDLLYIGTDNGTPWNEKYRSPGGGDNLYTCSIIAIRPKTGEYVWHFQNTPGDIWDFSATQHMILADIEIGGRLRKVLMQAPKNGYFYVLDRTDGTLISAANYVPVTWAKGIDPRTGRPIENPDARFDKTGKFAFVVPGAGGAHSWQPMAFNPSTGLVYLPAMLAGFPYMPESDWTAKPQGFNIGVDFGATAMPADPKVRAGAREATKGELLAWDPVAQKERWHVDFKGPWNGGLLATGGGLVFQGNSAKEFAAYDAMSGAALWLSPVQSGIIAAPVTFALDGEQYVAVLAGWGGIWALAPGYLSEVGGPVRNVSRILVFKLGAHGALPPEAPIERAPLDPPPAAGTPEQVAAGGHLYGRYCGVCHGDAAYGSTLVPDLRRSALLADGGAWASVVAAGARESRGMAGFAHVLDAGQVESIRHYVIKRANEDKALGEQ
jgi:alcohol dehydrogenase (cytochrome c)/quinohemoprotein ethanol dehydrogenase